MACVFVLLHRLDVYFRPDWIKNRDMLQNKHCAVVHDEVNAMCEALSCVDVERLCFSVTNPVVLVWLQPLNL